MLTGGIFEAYQRGTQRLASSSHVTQVTHGKPSHEINRGEAILFMVEAEDFLTDRTLSDETFDAASLLVRCADYAAIMQILDALEGQLTITLQMDDSDVDAARTLLPRLERKAGRMRILANGWPTGVEVCHAMVHGGPFPATSDSRTTSVGTLSIRRFLRPVCYQNLPAGLLPAILLDANPMGISRLALQL